MIPVKKTDPKDIKGFDIIPMLYANIFICAQKRSGKTNLIHKILESCINSNTKVIVFALTHELDDNWKYIKERLEKRKISVIFYTSIEEEKTNNLQDVLTYMSTDLTNQEEDKEENINDLIQVLKFNGKESYKVKVKSSKKQTPKFIIIFDDMSMELKKKRGRFVKDL